RHTDSASNRHDAEIETVDLLLYRRFDAVAEMTLDDRVESAAHATVRIGRRHPGADGLIEDRTLDDLHFRVFLEGAAPGLDHVHIDIDEDDLECHGILPTSCAP